MLDKFYYSHHLPLIFITHHHTLADGSGSGSPKASKDIRQFLVKLTNEEKEACLEWESEEHTIWLYVHKKTFLIDRDIECKRAAERQQTRRKKV